MKCNPWRWLWGIPLLCMWLWITLLVERDKIQDDLRTRSGAELKQAGMGWALPAFAGRDGLISGRTADADLPDKAVETVRRVWGVRVANKNIDLVEVITDYEWSATQEDDAITLGGYTPSEDDRETILAYFKARFPQSKIVDRMTLTANLPDKAAWLNGVKFAASQMRSLKSGRARLDNLGLTVSGEAKDFVAYKAVRGALAQGLPKGVTLVKDGVTPPVVSPFSWSAELSTGKLLLTGHVPSEQLREDLFTRAKDLFKNVSIVDRMHTAAGAPEDWATAAYTSLEQLVRLTNGKVAMSDQNLQLAGEAPDQATAEAVRLIWNAGIPGTFELTDNLTYPEPKAPVVLPYKTSLTSELDNVVVSGYVPDEDTRASVLKEVRNVFIGRTTIDKLKLGSGQSDGWRQCLSAGIAGLAKLSDGTASLRDKNLVVTGVTKDEALAAALPDEVRVGANRSCDTEVRVSLDVPPEPSLEWSASHEGDGRIILAGEVPDVATKAALIARAGELFTGAEVIDQMQVAGVLPRNWQSTAFVGLEQLARLRKGKAIISRQSLLLQGEAIDAAVATAVKDKVQTSLNKGYGGRHQISVRSDAQIWAEEEARKKAETEKLAVEEKARAEAEAEQARQRKAQAEADAKRLEEARKKAEAEAERLRLEAEKTEAKRAAEITRRKIEAKKCEKLLDSAAAEGSIRFGWASADLTSQSRPTLNKLAKIANECPGFQIEIEGHTDAEGTPERNKILSERRAQSVVDYLKKAGVDGSRLSAVGYGETRPIAPNDTAANRAKNRRIEFGVKVD